MRKGGSTDADLGVLARREKLGVIAGRARAASEALVSMAVCAAGIEATPETLATVPLDKTVMRLLSQKKNVFISGNYSLVFFPLTC